MRMPWTLRRGRSAILRDEVGWSKLLSLDLDTDTVVKDIDDYSYQRDAPVGVRLAQALQPRDGSSQPDQHGADLLGVEPPAIESGSTGMTQPSCCSSTCVSTAYRRIL